MTAAALPTREAVAHLLEQLLEVPVIIRFVPPAATPGPLPDAVVALYARADDEVGAVWTSSLQFAAFAGAAMTRIHLSVAREQIARGRLGDMVEENFREIMNVGSSLFNAILVR